MFASPKFHLVFRDSEVWPPPLLFLGLKRGREEEGGLLAVSEGGGRDRKGEEEKERKG